MTFLETLKRLDAEATRGPWFSSEDYGVYQTAHITRDIWQIPQTFTDQEIICLLRNNASAIIELVGAVKEFHIEHSDSCAYELGRQCDCGHDKVIEALANLRGDCEVGDGNRIDF